MQAPFDLRVTDALLSTTRAVRRRLDLERPVPRELILDCIRLSQQAPTASNSQAWHWVVVEDPARRRALAGIYRRVAEKALPQGRKLFAQGDPQTGRVYDSAEWLAEHMGEVPLLVIPCLKQRLPDSVGNAMACSHYGSIFPAVWSFQLALRSRGLGSAFTTLHLYEEEAAGEILGIPASVCQVGLLPVAYTRGTDFRPVRRPPPESITHWDGWNAETAPA